MAVRDYEHQVDFRIHLTSGSDDRAPGGAVTVALCGHWDHDGPCRWPHFSALTRGDDDLDDLTVAFNASAADIETVKSLIKGALQTGRLTGPDGRESTWQLKH